MTTNRDNCGGAQTLWDNQFNIDIVCHFFDGISNRHRTAGHGDQRGQLGAVEIG